MLVKKIQDVRFQGDLEGVDCRDLEKLVHMSNLKHVYHKH